MTKTKKERILNLNDLPEPKVSENAKIVLRERYLAKDDEGQIVEDFTGMYARVAEAVAGAESASSSLDDQAAKEYWAREFYDIMSQNDFVPNSPTIMNAGRRLGMLSACFVLPVEDDLVSIMDTQRAVALVQRAGGGTGFSFGRLRPDGSIVGSSGGTTTGPLAFIDSYSATTNAIQQGAFRRGANMAILPVYHADIIRFINAKANLDRWQNYNVSIAMTEEWMGCLLDTPNNQHRVGHPKWGKGALYQNVETGEVQAFRDTEEVDRDIWSIWTYEQTWDLIATRAWTTGEPGLFFVDEVNKHNPLLNNLGPIEATNPCGEQPLHSWDSCNLGSINLANFYDVENNKVDYKRLRQVAKTATRFLDNVIEINNFPTPEFAQRSAQTRRIGLGIMGWADLLFAMEIPYDSGHARSLAKDIMKAIDEASTEASLELAEAKGAFGAWEGSTFEERGIKIRNSFRTTIAPTGTISIIADCSGGIEPIYALSFTRRVMPDSKGNFKVMVEFNKHFKNAVDNAPLHEEDKQKILDYVQEHGNLHGYDWPVPMTDSEAEAIKTLREVFVTSHEITPTNHVLMQAAWQEHIDSAVSKTINLPNSSTVQDVKDAYMLAYESGCKGVTVYRDGCRDNIAGMQQPMSLRKEETPEVKEEVAEEPKFETVGEIKYDEKFLPAYRMRVNTQWGNLHLFVVSDPDTRRETEIFAQLGKAGDLVAADIEGMCRMASRLLDKGGSLEEIIDQFKGIGSTHTGAMAPGGPISSVPDAIARGLEQYIAKKNPPLTKAATETAAKLVAMDSAEEASSKSSKDTFLSAYGVPCSVCNGKLVFQEGCKKCMSCGYSAC